MATLHFLTKINIQSCLEIKRRTLIDFQNKIIQNMCASMGSVQVITEGDKIKIRSNIQDLCELSKEEVVEMFNQTEIKFNEIFGSVMNQIHASEKKLNRTSALLESEKHKKEMYMSEVVTLKSALMDRVNN